MSCKDCMLHFFSSPLFYLSEQIWRNFLLLYNTRSLKKCAAGPLNFNWKLGFKLFHQVDQVKNHWIISTHQMYQVSFRCPPPSSRAYLSSPFVCLDFAPQLILAYWSQTITAIHQDLSLDPSQHWPHLLVQLPDQSAVTHIQERMHRHVFLSSLFLFISVCTNRFQWLLCIRGRWGNGSDKLVQRRLTGIGGASQRSLWQPWSVQTWY